MRISSPPTTHSCFYGIDTPERGQLLAAQHTVEEMADLIGADSLAFISLDGLYRALGRPGRDPDAPQAAREVTVDYVPEGAVKVHREMTVCAADGDIGHFQGLVVDPGGRQVTHVLLQQGHMRGRREVAIPIGAVTKIGTLLIHLGLTRRQVKDLPPVDIDHPAR